MIVIGLAVALGTTMVALAYALWRQQKILNRMNRLDSRVRMLGLVDALARGEDPRDRARRHLRSVKGLILLPIAAAIGWARARPARAATIGGATAVGLTLGALTLWPAGPGTTEAGDPSMVRPRRRPAAIVGSPEQVSEAPRFTPPVAPDIAGEGDANPMTLPPPPARVPGAAPPPPRPPVDETTPPPQPPVAEPPPTAAPTARCVLELDLVVTNAQVCLPPKAPIDEPGG